MLGSSLGCWPEVASGHGAAEATGGEWKREGDGGHALEWGSKTGSAQWLQVVMIGNGRGSNVQ